MKHLLTAATIGTLIAAPALATPIDALTLYVLLGATAFGSSLINETAFSGLPRTALRVYARINHGLSVRQ